MKLTQEPLSRTFGAVDLYCDMNASDKEAQLSLERALGTLESKAGMILSNARKNFEAGKKDVEMTRAERDLLRKFLFIMLYRSKKFGNGRFGGSNSTADDYLAPDRDMMLEYMAKQNITRPIAVWFETIRAIIDLEMDPEQEWSHLILERVYPLDGLWFVNNMQMSYMAFATPSDAGDEFILTENAYGVFEGPNQHGVWCDFHVFAPLTPRLLIVVRSNMLPSGYTDDEDEEQRLEMLANNAKMFHNPSTAKSQLEDMPIKRARNNYSRVVNNKMIAIKSKLGSPEKHKFFFDFHSIPTEFVQKINIVFLEEAIRTESIAYYTKVGLKRAIEAYLQIDGFKSPVEDIKVPEELGYGALLLRDSPPALQSRDDFLDGLERIARELGSTVKAKKVHYGIDPISMFMNMRPRPPQTQGGEGMAGFDPNVFMNMRSKPPQTQRENVTTGFDPNVFMNMRPKPPQTQKKKETAAPQKGESSSSSSPNVAETAKSLPGLKGLWK